jgi:epoxyqueuosine reductase
MERNKQNSEDLKKTAFAGGARLFGIADVKDVKKEFLFSEETLKELDYAVCVGMRLSGAILDDMTEFPTKIYYHHYRQVNTALDHLALKICDTIQSMGYKALPVPASQIIDWKKQTAQVSHKKIGYLAGLGFIGKNNLLVNPEFGSRIRLVSVLTDMPMETNKPLDADCGDCNACVKKCPAGAIKESQKDFDHTGCYEKLREFRDKNFVGQFICGICVRECRGGTWKNKQ